MIFLGQGYKKFNRGSSFDKTKWKNIKEYEPTIYEQYNRNKNHIRYTHDIIAILESNNKSNNGIYDEKSNIICKFNNSGFASVYQMTCEEFIFFKLKFL